MNTKETLANKTYYLCIEDKYAGYVMQEWIRAYKDMPLSFRNAAKGVEGSFVLAVRDVEGEFLSFINKVAGTTRARISVK